jgi:hypothetical protein
MQKKVGFMFVVLFILTLFTPLAADARHRFDRYVGSDRRGNTPAAPATTTPTAPASPATSTPSTPVVIVSPPVVLPAPTSTPTTPGETTFAAYITGYSYWDNTPAGTAEISHPIIHQKAGGTGTFNDPITLAVGHSIINGKDILDYPAGTKFYLPYLQKYVIVEDTCGDGSTPQNGPCHTGYKGNPWIDLYVDGQGASQSTANNCMNAITGVHSVIKNPGANYPVTAGSVVGSGCKQY